MATTLAQYLKALSPEEVKKDPAQQAWYDKLSSLIAQGRKTYEESNSKKQALYQELFQNQIRTEELKAWYGAPQEGDLFQGTSVSSLTIPCKLKEPLILNDVKDLENAIADEYIKAHDAHETDVRQAIVEDVEGWIKEGLYYGIVIGSKMITQAFGLTVPAEDIVFEVDGHLVDPHEITHYPDAIREKYFEICRKKIDCFQDLEMTVTEFETSLVLADISKPRIEKYKNRIMLAPIKCNEICSVMAKNVKELIIAKTQGRIKPRSIVLCIYDTDTPYTYHQIEGYYAKELSPVLPGLTVMGTSGTIDAFRWLYTYRTSLITQKMMKSSLASEVQKEYIPFVFFGVLVPRDAEILLDLNNLDKLRYRGNLSPYIEFCYHINSLKKGLESTNPSNSFEDYSPRLT